MDSDCLILCQRRKSPENNKPNCLQYVKVRQYLDFNTPSRMGITLPIPDGFPALWNSNYLTLLLAQLMPNTLQLPLQDLRDQSFLPDTSA